MIGIAGGSGSGKTTFARHLTDLLGSQNVAVLGQDNYYIDQSHRFDRDGGQVNFDHPDSIDWGLLKLHLSQLQQGREIAMPIYDFATHKRLKDTILIEPKPHVILDGILIYVHQDVRDLIGLKLFIKTRESLRFERRLRRDTVERGRTEKGVRDQFYAQVKPMHDQFVEPSMSFADQIISGETHFDQALQEIVAQLTLSRP